MALTETQTPSQSAEMDKRFDPQSYEPKWQRLWAEMGIFEAEAPSEPEPAAEPEPEPSLEEEPAPARRPSAGRRPVDTRATP